jgi:hypothetical protein
MIRKLAFHGDLHAAETSDAGDVKTASLIVMTLVLLIHRSKIKFKLLDN